MSAPAGGARSTLLLFDVDGTLVKGVSPIHQASLRAALVEVYELPQAAVRLVPPAGRTDGEIARLTLLQAGVSEQRIDERVEDLRAACCEQFARRCPDDLADAVIPGIAALLEELAARDDVALSLVTGNFEPIARLKLLRAGLAGHFPPGQGAFGSDNEDRAELPAIARRRAAVDGRAFARTRTIVIGDTPRDIACARADGVRCIAVATGPHPAEDLTDADAVARDAHELRRLMSSLIT